MSHGKYYFQIGKTYNPIYNYTVDLLSNILSITCSIKEMFYALYECNVTI